MNSKNLIILLIPLFASFGTPLVATTQFTFDFPVPNLNIDFEWDGNDVTENGLYEFALNQEKVSSYAWSTGVSGQIYGEIYKGELNNATLTATHLFNSSSIATTTDTWLSEGNYFVVIYNFNTSCGNVGDICFLPKLDDIQEWFESGFSFSNFFSSPPENWGIINFTVVAQAQNNPPLLDYSQDNGYTNDLTSQGVEPNKGTADKTEMIFKAVYTDDDNNAPSTISVVITNGTSTTTLSMLPDIEATAMLTDNDFTNGEQYTSTSTFPKGKYQYYFETSDGTDIVRLPATETLTFETGFSNVAFLPGLKASRLYQEGSIFENQLWEPNVDIDVEKLFLDSSGNSENENVYTRDVIDQANIIPGDILSLLRQNFYISFKNDMDELVDEKIINDWKALPYDWRLGFDDLLASGKVIGVKGDEENVSYLSATSSPYIIQEIERLAGASANGKVTIVVHSMGGLLAKKLVNKLETKGEAGIIENLILVATPQLGTPKAITSLLHGYKEDIPKDFGFFSSRQTARQFSRNLIPGYSLLPFSSYMDRVKDIDEAGVVQNSTIVIEFDSSLDGLNDTIAFRDFWGTAVTTLDSVYNYRDYYGDGISTAQKLNEFLLGAEGRIEPAFDELGYPIKLSSSHLTSASNTHEMLDAWQPPQDSNIKVIQIAGWGLDTIRGIKYVAKNKQVCTDNLSVCSTLPVLDFEPLFTSDGDKVVVTPSATAMSTSTYPTFYVNIFDYNRFLKFQVNREHSDILEIDSIRDFIVNIIEGKQDILPDYITITKPPSEDTNLRLALHSPVSINIYDGFGNHTGMTLDETSGTQYTEEQIPNSYYMEFGEGKYLGLDTSDEYSIELQGEDFGTFTFEIQEVLGDKVLNSVEYKNISVSPATKVKLTVQNLDTTPELSVDIDGDGISDATLTGDEDNDVLVSVDILKNIVSGLEINKGLEKHILKKLKKVKKELQRDRTEKTAKHLSKIIKKLKKEVKKNLKVEDSKEEGEEHKKEKNNHKKHKEERSHDGDKEKISTKDAWMLISIIEDIKSLLL